MRRGCGVEEGVVGRWYGGVEWLEGEGGCYADVQSDDTGQNDFGESSGVVEIAARCGSALVFHRANPVAGVTRNAGDGFLGLLDRLGKGFRQEIAPPAVAAGGHEAFFAVIESASLIYI